jgi:hypothetical protein
VSTCSAFSKTGYNRGEVALVKLPTGLILVGSSYAADSFYGYVAAIYDLNHATHTDVIEVLTLRILMSV